MRSFDPYVRPYAAAIGKDFILMDDNARPHRARIVEEYLEDHGLERMEWPARSPDLNPIEHLRDYLGREVAALNPPPRSLHELKQGLLCVWSSLPIPVPLRKAVNIFKSTSSSVVGLLPTEVSNLIAKESVVDAQDYYKILLKRFKLSAEKFQQMFSRHTKDPVKTWHDFYFDLQTYFYRWLKESKVTTLEELKNLIVADQIKKKAPQDYKDLFLDQWCSWNNPLQLVDKLDSYEEVRNM
ncbi:transposable element Tcb2 transposase [Trichonephila clavipes]|nr:transposable element Tcb2 transposase [Trichonephila clavipes]